MTKERIDELESVKSRIMEIISEANGEETEEKREGNGSSGDANPKETTTQNDDTKENTNDGNGDGDDEKERDGEDEKKRLKPGETTSLNSFREFFDLTKAKFDIRREGQEPSPLFGDSIRKHNKFRVTITNEDGRSMSWIYWDDSENMEKNRTPDMETVMRDFGLKLDAVKAGLSYDEFKKRFGFENVDDVIANKQYQNVKKTMNDVVPQLFPDQHNSYQISQLAKKISPVGESTEQLNEVSYGGERGVSDPNLEPPTRDQFLKSLKNMDGNDIADMIVMVLNEIGTKGDALKNHMLVAFDDDELQNFLSSLVAYMSEDDFRRYVASLY